jgi:hypothetical protein
VPAEVPAEAVAVEELPQGEVVAQPARAPSAPAYSSPVASSRTDIDISDSCVSTPSSANSRSRVG